MKPAELVATLTVLVAAWFHAGAAAILAMGFACAFSGRDPLYLIAATANWLRTELQIFAGLVIDGWGEWMDRRARTWAERVGG